MCTRNARVRLGPHIWGSANASHCRASGGSCVCRRPALSYARRGTLGQDALGDDAGAGRVALPESAAWDPIKQSKRCARTARTIRLDRSYLDQGPVQLQWRQRADRCRDEHRRQFRRSPGRPDRSLRQSDGRHRPGAAPTGLLHRSGDAGPSLDHPHGIGSGRFVESSGKELGLRCNPTAPTWRHAQSATGIRRRPPRTVTPPAVPASRARRGS